MILDRIHKENDIKKISKSELPRLAGEIREFLIEKVSETGGHLGSNLGVVELTIALHRQLTLPKDKIVFDVGHQAYIHKLLTGRREGFDTLRQFGGMSGFPKRAESDCDVFDTGHSSTSISVGLGLVKARDLKKENYTVVSVIGDGALTGGLAYEGLNNAAKLKTNYIIILNDNDMSISENVGGMSKYLQGIRTAVGYQNFKIGMEEFLLKNMSKRGEKVLDGLKRFKSSLKQLVVPGMLFEDMGITYLGPVDGHDIAAIEKAIREAKNIKHTVMIHVCTKKGKGYAPAERHPARFHGTGPFDIETGLPKTHSGMASYTDIFSTVMIKLAARNEKVCAITAAMPDGTGLKRYRNIYPERFADVGIAEGHAATFAAGLAAGGMRPVVAIYSSFLQRAYDEILHDVCIGNLPVIFAIDRAGIVGADGETHQGVFDLSFLSSMPNMTIMAPKNKWELSDMMKFALTLESPVAVRYPRSTAYCGLEEYREEIGHGRSEMIYEESGIAIFAVGAMVETAEQVRLLLKDRGYECTLINARFVKPIDEDMLIRMDESHQLIVTMEDNVLSGGYGEHVTEFAAVNNLRAEIINIAIPDEFVPHGSIEILREKLGMDPGSITGRIINKLQSMKAVTDTENTADGEDV
ncbi:MAG: 1-deoxy-D-xylulose-5-phosphate synthase [Lachnospiraceae bacterium]|nr:1-deoxy-D-xylulose-5-phosphate synthase [Lachnospiraceae bacterium]MBR1523413.1 1-deoxy-D-xylulose-5-phosphate synthase [Lachnospiraceae bacterium]